MPIRFCAVFFSTLLFLSFALPASSAPSGKLWTAYIGSGGYSFVKLYAFDKPKSNRNKRAAEAYFNKYSDGKAAPTNLSPPIFKTSADKMDLSALRFAIIRETAIANPNMTFKYRKDKSNLVKSNSVRTAYENLRTCWNAFAFSRLSSFDRFKCTSDQANYDKMDASATFTEPSLYDQIINGNVSKYRDANNVRMEELIYLATIYYNFYFGSVALSTSLPSFSETDVINCVISPSLTCGINVITGAESQSSLAFRTKNACAFASSAWLPTYTELEENRNVKSPKVPDYGAVPGC